MPAGSFYGHETAGPAEGSYDFMTGRAEYTAPWRCYTTSGLDNIEQLRLYVIANIAAATHHFGFGNDCRVGATLRKIDGKREAGSANPWVWIATLHYADPEAAGGGNDTKDNKDSNGNNTDNPLDLRPEMEYRTVQYQRPVEKATYISGYSGAADSFCKMNSSVGPIVNSAIVPFDPPIERDDSRGVLRIKRNLASLNCDTIFTNVINSKACSFSWRGISKSIAAYCGKIRDVSAVPRNHPTYGDYVECELFIDIFDDGKKTWRYLILDRGLSARAGYGDPDGHGGTFGASDTRTVTGIPPQRRITDIDGNPVSDPVLLDGNGQPLNDSKPTGALDPPVYSNWKDYTEYDWTNATSWPIFVGLIS
jgi:hypothetical protein